MPPVLSRNHWSLAYHPLPACALGEVTSAALLWDRGGTGTLEKLRTRTDLHLLVMCLEGRSDYVDEFGVTRVLLPGDVLLIPRGFAHSYRPKPGHGWSEIHVWMRGPLFDLWWSSGFLPPGSSVFSASPWLDAARQLCRLFEKPAASLSGSDGRLAGFQAWLTNLKGRQVKASSMQAVWFARACHALENGTLKEPALEDLARDAGISYETFRKTFAQFAGMSPGQYRSRAVMQRACRLIHHRLHGLKEIAEQLGFSDEFHFSRSFRRHIGLPPGQYRALTVGGSGSR